MQITDTDWMRVSDVPQIKSKTLIGRWQDRSCTEELYLLNGVEVWRRRSWPASRISGSAGVVWFLFNAKEG